MTNELRAWWGSWHDKTEFAFPLPERWELINAPMRDAPTLTDREIETRLEQPIGSPELRTLARGRRNACIAIDDLTRPTETFRILPPVIRMLNDAGIADDDILIIVSLGTHRPLQRQDLLKKIGPEILRRIRVHNHNPYLNLVNVGTTSFGTPLLLNATFYAADLKLSVGMVAPHSYAGFSAGGKIILPGLASWETVLSNHKPASKILSGQVAQIQGNTRRAEMNEAARLAGLEFSVNVVSNAKGETAALYCGETQAAWRAAALRAVEIYATDMPTDVDIGVFNAFPKDTELLQALNSLTPWNPGAGHRDVVRDGGSIVVITAASEGHGWLGLNNPGGPLHQRRDKHPVYAQMLANRRLYFLSPNLARADMLDHYPPEVQLFNEWNDLRAALEARHPTTARAAFFPCAPLQLSRADIKLAND